MVHRDHTKIRELNFVFLGWNEATVSKLTVREASNFDRVLRNLIVDASSENMDFTPWCPQLYLLPCQKLAPLHRVDLSKLERMEIGCLSFEATKKKMLVGMSEASQL